MTSQNAKILIIDDDRFNGDLLAARFRDLGHQVLTAADGEEGVEKALSENPDLIICDVLMPVKNGFQVCVELRNKGVSCPFLYMTAKRTSEDQVRGLQLGADDFVVKPFDPKVLEAKVDALLRRSPPSPQA
jgi:DNA-binding response OmpR family regulator